MTFFDWSSFPWMWEEFLKLDSAEEKIWKTWISTSQRKWIPSFLTSQKQLDDYTSLFDDYVDGVTILERGTSQYRCAGECCSAFGMI